MGVPYSRKSLNGEQRRKELIKITIENQAILQRLQKKQATYSVEKWNDEFQKQCRIREMVCENPYEFGNGLGLQRKIQGRIMTAQARGEQGRMDYLSNKS